VRNSKKTKQKNTIAKQNQMSENCHKERGVEHSGNESETLFSVDSDWQEQGKKKK